MRNSTWGFVLKPVTKSSFAPVWGIGMLPAKDVFVVYALLLPVPIVYCGPAFLARNLSLFRDSFRRSKRLMPHRFHVLMRRFCLMVKSRGLSGDRLGERLTSISHGFRSESRDVEPKYLKAVKAMHLVFFHCLKDIIITKWQRLENHIKNSGPHQIHIYANLL